MLSYSGVVVERLQFSTDQVVHGEVDDHGHVH